MTRRLFLLHDTEPGGAVEVRCDRCAHWHHKSSSAGNEIVDGKNMSAKLCARLSDLYGEAGDRDARVIADDWAEFASPPGFGCSRFERKDSP